jgi:predicted TIM-barrel fold metal-dependent hydrolase
MVVDAHVHLREESEQRQRRVCAEDLLRAMDRCGVEAAVVLPCPGLASNEFVRRECSGHPDRLVTLYLPDFSRPSDTLSKMSRSFEQHDARGIKIHPRLQQVRPGDTLVHEVVAWAQERKLPVLFDVFPHGWALAEPDLQPSAYHALASRFHGCTIVLAHSGGYRVMEAFMVAKANSNVILDNSFTGMYFRGSPVVQDLAFAIRHLWPGRTLYGSDFPEADLGEHLELTRQLLGDLSEDRARAFYGETAAKVFRIET